MPTEIGMMNSSISGVTSFRPSTAESTDSAGVIMASPRNRAAPMRPSTMSTPRWVPAVFISSASSESVPPSPSLSARSSSVMYLKVTMIVKDQIISDVRPMTSS
ncbi:hypothetical protein D3C71_614950 [compost metagenome]